MNRRLEAGGLQRLPSFPVVREDNGRLLLHRAVASSAVYGLGFITLRSKGLKGQGLGPKKHYSCIPTLRTTGTAELLV